MYDIPPGDPGSPQHVKRGRRPATPKPPGRATAETVAISNAIGLVRHCMRESGMTHREMADRLGVSRAAVGHWLTGHTNMSVATLAGMCHELGYTLTIGVDRRPAAGKDADIDPVRV